MFDTMNIAKKIKQARIDKNMTQMNLADAMGVSYQAVSNWERGNSMPDISKLGDLCAALDISVNELLGIDAPAVTKAMEQEELTMEELTEVAPLLPPEDVKVRMEGQRRHISFGDVDVYIEESAGSQPHEEKHAEAGKKKKKLDLSRIADMAPYLDQEYLDKLVEDADLDDLDGLEDLAIYLSKDTLEKIAERASLDDLDTLVEIAIYLSKEAVDKLIMRCAEEDELDDIGELAIYASKETLGKLAAHCMETGNMDCIEEIAPYLAKGTLDRMIENLIEKGFDPEELDEDISEFYPYLEKQTLQKLAMYLMEQRDLDALEELIPYV